MICYALIIVVLCNGFQTIFYSDILVYFLSFFIQYGKFMMKYILSATKFKM